MILSFSIVIPTMNRPETLKRTIACLLSKKYIPGQIIVVDQSSDEINRSKNKEVLYAYKNMISVKYIFQKTPSLTQARNNGFQYVTNDFIICSDDDVDVENNTLKNIYALMQDENISMIAGIDINTCNSKSKIGYLFDTKSYKNRKIGHVTKSILGRYPDHIIGEIDTQWAMGYFFAVRKSLIDKWNITWDENLISYAYPEDLDFTYSYYKKSQASNMKCILSDKVKVAHLASKEYRIKSTKHTYMYVINRTYLSYKHNMGFSSRLAIRWTNFGHLLERIAHQERPIDLIKAQWRCDINRKKIKKGELSEQFYK